MDAPALKPLAIAVTRITVENRRVICDVTVSDPRVRTTWPALGDAVREAFPDIVKHACVNDESDRFATVMDRTSLPHLLEHVAIDIQTHRSADEHAVFTGTTEWLDEARGTARIQLSYQDDFAALAAFRDALDFLNSAIAVCALPKARWEADGSKTSGNERITDS